MVCVSKETAPLWMYCIVLYRIVSYLIILYRSDFRLSRFCRVGKETSSLLWSSLTKVFSEQYITLCRLNGQQLTAGELTRGV